MYVPHTFQLNCSTNVLFLAAIYENTQKLNMPLNLFGSREFITALTLGMGKLVDLGCSVET